MANNLICFDLILHSIMLSTVSVVYVSVVKYFVFLIIVCVLATALTVVVLYMYLRAEYHPVAKLPAWVSMDCKSFSSTKKNSTANRH